MGPTRPGQDFPSLFSLQARGDPGCRVAAVQPQTQALEKLGFVMDIPGGCADGTWRWAVGSTEEPSDPLSMSGGQPRGHRVENQPLRQSVVSGAGRADTRGKTQKNRAQLLNKESKGKTKAGEKL